MDNKALFLTLVFFVLFFTLFSNGLFIDSNDSSEHREMGREPEYNTKYAPLLRSFSGWFAHSPQLWIALILFLFAVVTPLLLYKITGQWFVVPLYFFVTNYFYVVVGGGLFAQGLVIIFVLAMYSYKNNYVRLGLFFVGSLAHSTGPLLLGVFFLLLLLEENWKDWYKKSYDKFLLGCSPIFGYNAPDFLSNSVSVTSGLDWSLTFGSVASFLLKTCPFPFLFFSIKEWWFSGRLSFFGLFVFAVITSVFYNSRALLLIAPLMVVGFSCYWPRLKYKRVGFGLICLFGVFNFQQYLWVVLAIGC